MPEAKQKQQTSEDEDFRAKVKEVLDEERLGFLDVLGGHPIRHLGGPGGGNKVEAIFSAGGRVTAGYLIYKGVRWGIAKIF